MKLGRVLLLRSEVIKRLQLVSTMHFCVLFRIDIRDAHVALEQIQRSHFGTLQASDINLLAKWICGFGNPKPYHGPKPDTQPGCEAGW